ncbi:subtilisin-like protease SBT2.5 [Senna tora]|uniref:Subtilisin-like protease SBT2.5 n=1 Tax=Senna tora TaxID=362788 RepID=A0A834WLW6_9FABA|nr:subtilisin-like protease SBT2.5 [Senna tora]
MNYDPHYEQLRAHRTKIGAHELDVYLSRKHDQVLASTLEPGSYTKISSLVIVDGFAVKITEDQAKVLRSAKGVRVVEKNDEMA